MTSEIKFMWNGIKVNGKLYRASYGWNEAWDAAPEKHIPAQYTICAREYTRFPAEVREVLVVHNDTDSMTDYFDKDRARVPSDHPLFAEVKAAHEAQAAHRAKMNARRTVRGETKRLENLERNLENLRMRIRGAEQDDYLSPSHERQVKVYNLKRCEAALLADIEKTKAVIEKAKNEVTK